MSPYAVMAVIAAPPRKTQGALIKFTVGLSNNCGTFTAGRKSRYAAGCCNKEF